MKKLEAILGINGKWKIKQRKEEFQNKIVALLSNTKLVHLHQHGQVRITSRNHQTFPNDY